MGPFTANAAEFYFERSLVTADDSALLGRQMLAAETVALPKAEPRVGLRWEGVSTSRFLKKVDFGFRDSRKKVIKFLYFNGVKPSMDTADRARQYKKIEFFLEGKPARLLGKVRAFGAHGHHCNPRFWSLTPPLRTTRP